MHDMIQPVFQLYCTNLSWLGNILDIFLWLRASLVGKIFVLMYSTTIYNVLGNYVMFVCKQIQLSKTLQNLKGVSAFPHQI